MVNLAIDKFSIGWRGIATVEENKLILFKGKKERKKLAEEEHYLGAGRRIMLDFILKLVHGLNTCISEENQLIVNEV
jgi:hypothetical protein